MGMPTGTILKVMEYKIDPHQKGVGTPPEGKLIQEFSGRAAMVKANALREKLNKFARKGIAYFVKGEVIVPSIPRLP